MTQIAIGRSSSFSFRIRGEWQVVKEVVKEVASRQSHYTENTIRSVTVKVNNDFFGASKLSPPTNYVCIEFGTRKVRGLKLG